jgi:hypothetical protein
MKLPISLVSSPPSALICFTFLFYFCNFWAACLGAPPPPPNLANSQNDALTVMSLTSTVMQARRRCLNGQELTAIAGQ